MRKKPVERGYEHAKKEYEKTGIIPDMSHEKYALCSDDFRKGVEMFKNDCKK